MRLNGFSFHSSWQLDHTEGPNRIRNRLKRCHHNIHPRFFLKELRDDLQENLKSNEKLLQYLISSLMQSCNFCANEQVLYNFNVKHIPVDNEIEGELIITESQIIFMPNSEFMKVSFTF